jgi:hypothetical protein
MLYAGTSSYCATAVADSATEQAILARLAALEQNQRKLEEELDAKDARIQELEQRLAIQPAPDNTTPQSIATAPATTTPPLAATTPVIATAQVATTPVTATTQVATTPVTATTQVATAATPAKPGDDKEFFGRFQPGQGGFTIADTPMGSANLGLWAYVRYLNQLELDKSYTDSFDRTFEIDRRNDIQFNKVNLSFSGWLFDPNFRYLTYVWTNNTAQGDGAQVVVAGNFKYRFNPAVDVGVGIDALPGTRSMYGSFPYWNKVDMRTMSDEFFRPSYTSGIWSAGVLNKEQGLTYKLMLGNNLSQLGVNAAKLDGALDTWSGRLQWQPTTGEFGPQGGWGDFEMHQHLATQFGLSATYSREDRQSQPGTEDVNNSQIRLSDGTRLFVPDAFASGGSVERATYQMVSADAALKYQGFDLSTAFYSRWLDSFKTQGYVPVDNLYDYGFEVQTSYMFLPRSVQGYIASSKIFGEYGNPWDTAVGVNWYPMRNRLVRVNGELLYTHDSAVGNSSAPYVVGGDGPALNTNIEMKF